MKEVFEDLTARGNNANTDDGNHLLLILERQKVICSRPLILTQKINQNSIFPMPSICTMYILSILIIIVHFSS